MDHEGGNDPVLEALDDLIAALDDNMARRKEIIARAKEMHRRRRQGHGYREIVTAEERPLVVELIRSNLEALFEAGSRLRRAEAKALHDEGLTMEAIADLFGVTRQRVSALLREGRAESGGRGFRAPPPAFD